VKPIDNERLNAAAAVPTPSSKHTLIFRSLKMLWHCISDNRGDDDVSGTGIPPSHHLSDRANWDPIGKIGIRFRRRGGPH
jgi:hypothetical protein